ncbi:MAG: tol-pal system YbgF family protein, partial [Bacteriovoracia bacterium]
ARLAEIYQQTGAIYFRIAHGQAHTKKKAVDLKQYHGIMRKSIEVIDKLMRKFPQYEQMDVVTYMRGKAYEEIGNKPAAKRDYLTMVKKYPDAPETISAYMSLAEFSIEENQHQEAIGYLLQVEQHPESAFYPFSLFKLAWSYYNLRDIPTAISYLEKHVRHYDAKAGKHGGLTSSDYAIRENSLLDVALFYMDGIEMKRPEYQIEDALSYFRKMEDGPVIGKMLLRFAKLLRAHDHERELEFWKKQMIEKENKQLESLEVVITVFEYHLQRRHYTKIAAAAQDMVTLYQINQGRFRDFPGYDNAQKLLLDTAKEFQALTIKNKAASRVGELSNTLVALYDTFAKIVDEKDPRVPGVHYNLAETLFEIGNFADATFHYRWIVDHPVAKSPVSLKDASLKAIAARYEVLRRSKSMPEKLNAVAFKDESKKAVAPMLAEWIEWTDWHMKKFEVADATFENFVFEANRALYAQNKIVDATERLIRFAKKLPNSKFAITSASLALDTYIASQRWEESHDLANEFMNVAAWKKDDFHKHLLKLAADSFYKMIEGTKQAGNPEKAIAMCDEFAKKYPTSPRLEDALLLAGLTALDLKDKEKAEKYFSGLIARFPNSENTGSAMLSRAMLEEERFEHLEAARDYQAYIALMTVKKAKESDLLPYRKKVLHLHWISGDVAVFRKSLDSKTICVEELAEQCQMHRTLLTTLAPKAPSMDAAKEYFKHATHADNKDLRPLWALSALAADDGFEFPDRLLLIRVIAGRWDNLDPLVQFTILSRVSQIIPAAFEKNRVAMQRFAKLTNNERSINRRIELIKEMESTATQVMKMPWAHLRAMVMNHVATLYLDFAQDLTNLPVPEGLAERELANYQEMIRKITMPFEEKGQDIRRKAFEIASHAAVNEPVLAAVTNAFFQDNPSQAKALKPDPDLRPNPEFNFRMLAELDPKGEWRDAEKDRPKYKDGAALYLKAQWAQALRAQNWVQATHLIQEAKNRKLIDVPIASLMKAYLLVSLGARAEGLSALAELRRDLAPRPAAKAATLLTAHYLHSLAREQAKRMVEAIQSENEEKGILNVVREDEDAFTLALAARWSGAKLSEKNEVPLFEQAADVSDRAKEAWARQVLRELKAIREKRSLANR